jgi:Lipoprotein LpqB beta-propeller domain/Sporulation and spore germination
MRRRLFAAAAALGLALAAAGCGVPDRTDVVVDSENRATDVSGPYGGEELPPGPEGTSNNVEEFVRRFLEAPAGDWEGAPARVKRFLHPQLQASWQPPREGITVVRLVNGKPDIKPAPSSDVVLDVQQIGVLTNRGTLEPPTSRAVQYTFTVGPVDSPAGGLAVTNAPPVMLLTDNALSRWYEQRPIYFWDTGQNNLVPDLRWLPRAAGDDRRPQMLIGWLLGGPVGWLRPSVLELPDGTEQLGNAYKKDGRLIVNLSNAATATGQSLDLLFAQVVWSLRHDFFGEVVLQIEWRNRREGSSADYLNRNPAYRSVDRGEQRYAVADGVVRRVQIEGPEVPAAVPVLDASVNRNVRSAALTNGRAAVVRVEGGQLVLWVGPDPRGRFLRTPLKAAAMSRPVLADGQDVGYVAAGGKLYQFGFDRPEVAEVTASGLPGGVTSVARAPDGRRLAVVAGGGAYLVALGGDGGEATGTARPVPVPLDNLTAISWLSETSLAMAGGDGNRTALAKVSMDGGVLISSLQDLSTFPVTQLVSFPENPVSGIGGRILMERDHNAYEVFAATQSLISPQAVAGPPARGVLTAPFFME